MFEDSLSQGGWVDSLRANPALALVYLGLVPFAILWILHNSLWTGFAMQLYLVTAFVFVLEPFAHEKPNLRKRWFWKAMLTRGAPIHLLFMGGLWCLDARYPIFVTGTGTVFFMLIVVGGVEATQVSLIVDRSRPKG